MKSPTSNAYPIPPHWLEHRVEIDLIGAGGTGSQVADQLASLQTTLMMLGHPGFRVNVWDFDSVSPSNVGRQRYTRADVGLKKTDVLVHRINNFYGLDWTSVDRAFAPRSNHVSHLLITCVDKASLRAAIGENFTGSGLWLDFGNGATDAQVVLGRFRKGRYENRPSWDVLPNVYDLYPDLASMSAADNELPSCSTEEAIRRQAWPTNRAVAMAGMEILWNFFRNGKITHHGAYLTGNPLTVTPLPVDPATWAFLGYELPAYARPKRASKRAAIKKAA